MKVPPRVGRALYWAEQGLRGRGPVRSRLLWLRKTAWMSPAEIRRIQMEKLHCLLAHAYRTVPYYRRVMDERGLRPGDFATPDDLSKLPLLTRAVLAREKDALLSSEADRATLQTNYSSGSTGVRAEFKQDLDFRMWMRAHQLRTYEWCSGWRLGDPFVLLWGSEIYWSLKSITDRLENALTNRRELNTFRLSRELVSAFVDKLLAFRPALVSTYSNAMHLIAREAERRRVRFPGLRAVQGTSEPLPPAFRERIADVLGCAVYDKYGMRETNIVAHESPRHEGMCIQAENVHVEFLNGGRPCAPGEKGTIVVTSLNSYSMPLIRYETSDVGAPLDGHCSSGIGLPRMSHVAGRMQDLIVTPAGDHVDAYFFSYLLMRFPEVHWFQVVQREMERLTLRVFAPSGLDARVTSEIVERIHHHAGYPFKIDFETLREMPPSSTGKFRLCVSEIGSGSTRIGDGEGA